MIQTSENFKLHDDIHNFLHHIFMEILVNEMYLDSLALKYFRRHLMQLELTLMEREKQSFSSISEWSSFMKDLTITLDLINILTNKTKAYQLSELFFTESKDILGEKLTLTKEMVETAQTHFDRTADEQVMKISKSTRIHYHMNLLSISLKVYQLSQFQIRLSMLHLPAYVIYHRCVYKHVLNFSIYSIFFSEVPYQR